MPTSTTPETAGFANIKPVTKFVAPDTSPNRHWRLLAGSQLSSAALLTSGNLRAILRLYVPANYRDQSASKCNLDRLEGIVSIDVKQSDRLIGRTMYRGYEVALKLIGDHFSGPGDLFMFGSVLDRFLGGYVTQHCFVHLTVEETQKGYRFDWPMRLGDRYVI
jgi:type VI secretion system protein ImpG